MASKKNKTNIGRPTVMTSEVFTKLQTAFSFGCNATEARAFAGISHNTYHNYLKEHPEFKEKIADWRLRPVLKAKRATYQGLDDPAFALKYLERVRKDEFGVRTEITGANGTALNNTLKIDLELVGTMRARFDNDVEPEKDENNK